MRMRTFGRRCAKEILRDPINLLFGLGFPVVLLFLLSAIQANVPVALFEIQHLTPGITVFSLAFITLFSATLIARDRETALLQRLYTTPLKPVDYILGYLLPMVPIALAQCVVCYAFAVALGLPLTFHIFYAGLALFPAAMFYVALGLLCGSVLNVKQVGGICGALLTNLSAWLSGVWFDLELVGGTFQKIAKCLPFLHAVELERAVIRGDWGDAMSHFLPVVAYACGGLLAAILLFLRQMKSQ